jgi:hypothetical protein
VTYSEVIWLGYKGERFTVEFGQKSDEIFAGEGPLKGRGAALIVGLEGEQTLLEFGQRREIVGGENFFFERSRNRFRFDSANWRGSGCGPEWR